jgi:cytochrome c-type biogenesis protein CcmH/NrfG
LIWLILVALVFVGGGSYLVAKTWTTRGIVFFAGVVAALSYIMLGKPDMPDDPLQARLEQLAKKPEADLSGVEYLAIQEQRLKNSPNDPEPHKKIGDLYAAAGRPQDAMQSYSAALTRDPNYKPALDAISALQFQVSGEVDQATRDRLPEIRQLAQTNPESLTAVQFMALLEERVSQAPDDSKAYQMMGKLLASVGQVEKAEAAYREVLKRDDRNVEVLADLADMRFKSSKLKIDAETSDLYHRAYKLDPANLRVGYMAGIGDWVAGKQAEARKQLAEIDARTPEGSPYPQMFAALRQMFGIDPAPPVPPK